MLRADLHHHIDADAVDGRFIRHSMGELIDRAAHLGLNVLAVTCHEGIPYDEAAVRHAAARDILLLRGMEATVDGTHVLLLNFREFPAGICTMAEMAAHKDAGALVIAPHPFYPSGVAGGEILRAHRSLFDAVEFSGMYTAMTPIFNRRAQQYARAASLPVVGNSDTHFLWQPGRTFTQIDAQGDVGSVIEAIRHGRVELVTRPLSWHHVMRFLYESQSSSALFRDAARHMLKMLRRTRRAERSLTSPAL